MHPEAYRQQMAAAAAAGGGGGYPSRFRPPPPSYASHFPAGASAPVYRPPPHALAMPPGSQPSANGPYPQVRILYVCVSQRWCVYTSEGDWAAYTVCVCQLEMVCV